MGKLYSFNIVLAKKNKLRMLILICQSREEYVSSCTNNCCVVENFVYMWLHYLVSLRFIFFF